jgi:DNA polymerase V
MDEAIDLHRLLVRNLATTFLYRADGWSMCGIGVSDGDILVVDRSVSPQGGDLVIAIWDGNQPSCKVLQGFMNHLELHSANADFPSIVLEQDTEVEIFAVVGVVRQIKRRGGHVRPR